MSSTDIKRALVIGASGQLGAVLLERLENSGVTTRGTFCHNGSAVQKQKPSSSKLELVKSGQQPLLVQLDLLDRGQISDVIEDFSPDCIYVAGAYTDVDGCELEPERSNAINVQGVRDVVAAARELSSCRLVYFSSDFVFDGLRGPYDEKAKPSPASVYGKHKVEAERVVASSGLSNVIIRTSTVFGRDPQSKNFIARLLASLQKGESVVVPDDQIANPTYNETLADAAIELCNSYNQGLFNVAGATRVSRYQLALDAAAIFALPTKLISASSTLALKQAAKRPLMGGLVINRAKSALKTELIGHVAGLQKLKAVLAQESLVV
ncbi:MAG: SDR family oxidoreductase [Candidatus Melainabacteria bacterium]|nr:SDR family oxidoreductase [Candidatus Melainabacteria bacterium]